MAENQTYTYKLRYARIAPRKLRYVVDLVRGKDVNTADSILKFCPKRGAPMCRKLLQSAISSTSDIADRKRIDIDVNRLYIHEIRVDSGPTKPTKRTKPGFRRPYLIRKRFSNLIMVLKEKKEKTPAKAEASQEKKPKEKKPEGANK